MFKDFDVNIIDEYLKEKFPVVLKFKFNGLMLLRGGTLRDLIMGKNDSKDLDFVLLTQGKWNMEEFIQKYNIEVLKASSRGIGYKLKYNDVTVDMFCTNDLYKSAHLSTDFLFYDINRKILIPIGIKQSIKKNIIYDYRYQQYYKTKKRVEKSKKFLTYLNHKKKPRVIYKYNRPYYLFLALCKKIKRHFRRDPNVK